MSRPIQKTILIDVRTRAEFATGFLTAHSTPAINIEYQAISQLPDVLLEHGYVDFKVSDPITLYCRSGRRSDIALRELEGLGYSKVRDIGGFEEAREVLEREDAEDRVWEGKGDVEVVEIVEIEVTAEDDEKKEARRMALGKLLEELKQGLKEEN